MKVDFDKFLKWIENRFDNFSVKGKEIKINSIFTEDTGMHLWCNPSGGKKNRSMGVYHCFKTDQKGSLVKLVQLVDSCDRQDAIDTLAGRTSIRDLEKKLEKIFGEEEIVKPVVPKSGLFLPPCCELISSLSGWWRNKAEEYLTNRKIPIDGLYICTDDKYKGRIIIPYFDNNGKLIYWNARHIGKSKCKYLGPPKEVGVGKEDVVYMAGMWPEPGELVYLCEGEFNAKSLKIAEFNAAACGGKNMSEKQALLLSDYRIVLCLDRDKAGTAGSIKMSSVITAITTAKKTTEKLKYVVPPKGYNDWNEFLIKNNAEMLHYYVLKNQKMLDYAAPLGMGGDYIAYNNI